MVAADKLRAVVEQDYAALALGEKYYGAVHTWGYTHELLDRLGMKASDELHKKLFKAACGGGCPLLLTPGYFPGAGETVVDLGCGAGHDCILAAKFVGPTGRVIGIDLTQKMLDRASQNVAELAPDCAPVIEFKRGLLDDGTLLKGLVDENVADLVMSNGVFNLTTDKAAAFRSAFRILKPGGRFHLCDLCKVEEPVVDAAAAA
jgi:SAM-dependent methyltransferase